jgi:phospho-N-acetylmuramoyl-pentapeptide-transferase
LGIGMPIVTFFFTITIVNAINITDWLDGLAAGLLLIVFWVIAVMTFVTQRYIATTLIAVVLWWLLAFLWFNINPAKIFMWDSWALALWWVLSALVYLLNIRFGVFIPFLLLMLIFWAEIWSSLLQILSKKLRKKKLFTVAPVHHLLEHRGYPEATIVMKFWVIQWVLGVIAVLVLLLYVTFSALAY